MFEWYSYCSPTHFHARQVADNNNDSDGISPVNVSSSAMSTNLLTRKHLQARSAQTLGSTQPSIKTLRKALAVAKMRSMHGKEGCQKARIAELEAKLKAALQQKVADEGV